MPAMSELSLAQAPPIDIPFRFFLTAPAFALLVALALAFSGEYALVSRWSPSVLAATHWLTLGFMTMVMIGATLQMLPVLVGAPIPQVKSVGAFVHATLTLGALLLGLFFLTGYRSAAILGGISLALAMAVFLAAVMLALYRLGLRRISGMGHSILLAIGMLALASSLGLTLLGEYAGVVNLPNAASWTDLHLGLGFGGWMSVLFAGIAFQVVPMFHVTQEYPIWMKKGLPGTLSAVLLAWALAHITWDLGMQRVLNNDLLIALFSLLLTLFILQTLRLHRLRTRRVPDITIMFWNLGLGMALLALVLMNLEASWLADRRDMLLGLLILPGAILALIQGMLYRIVPFLSWFHLQHQQLSMRRLDIRLPHVKAYIPDIWIRAQLALYAVSLALLTLALFFPGLVGYLALACFALSNLLLMLNLVGAARIFLQMRQKLTASQDVPGSPSP